MQKIHLTKIKKDFVFKTKSWLTTYSFLKVVIFMGGKRDKTLQIYTLGPFEVRRGKEIISRAEQRLNKRWRFFQILITYKGKALSSEQMYKYLNLEESVNPPEALKSLAFYLRNSLKSGLVSPSDEQYIISSQGRYIFNENSDYWLDAEEFEALCIKASTLAWDSEEKAIEIYKKALSLYRGNYLGDVPHSHWTIPLRNHYRELYLRAMLAANDLLRKAGRYEEAWELCEGGLRIVPLEEKLHTSSLEALIDAGKHGLALVQFDEATALFRENGLNIPTEMKIIGDRLKQSNKIPGDPENMLGQLQGRRKFDGAFESCVETFSAIYELEKARSERGESSGYLISLDLNGTCTEADVKRVGQALRKTLKTSLRKGDVICGWSPRKFLALLQNVSSEEIEKIIKRVEQKASGEITECPLEIQSNWQKI